MGAAELYALGFAFGIFNFLPAPPAFALQDGGEFAAEFFQRPPLFSGIDDGGIDVGEYIHFGGFGHRKGSGVRVVQHILPIPRYGNAFLL
ncbi:Uncharacterised protein [Mycobacteroides abscessus subsp. massiliense]|nr:Uncharacterised protein [Mycobacteroides abscessus subsp. massiliense]